jgi:Uma2 family endonuclease
VLRFEANLLNLKTRKEPPPLKEESTTMTPDRKTKMTSEEFVAMERHTGLRAEWLNGGVYAIAGGSHLHWLVATNIAGELRHRLKNSENHVLNSGMRLKVVSTNLYAHPDVVIVQGDPAFEDDQKDTLLNPKIIIEVLSDQTAAWDRGGKFWHYRQLDSLSDYIVVSQETRLADHYTRQPNGSWMLKTIEGEDGMIQLTSIKTQLPLVEIYANTKVPHGQSPAANKTPHPQVKA